MPPVREVRGQDGVWGTVGQTRTIATTDGGTLLETLTTVDRPHRFGYVLTDVHGPMRPLVRRVEGVWSVSPENGGSRIGWAWTLLPDRRAGPAADAPAGPDVAGLRPPRPRAGRADPGGLSDAVRRFGRPAIGC